MTQERKIRGKIRGVQLWNRMGTHLHETGVDSLLNGALPENAYHPLAPEKCIVP